MQKVLSQTYRIALYYIMINFLDIVKVAFDDDEEFRIEYFILSVS